MLTDAEKAEQILVQLQVLIDDYGPVMHVGIKMRLEGILGGAVIPEKGVRVTVASRNGFHAYTTHYAVIGMIRTEPKVATYHTIGNTEKEQVLDVYENLTTGTVRHLQSQGMSRTEVTDALMMAAAIGISNAYQEAGGAGDGE